jgi:DNA primase
MDFAEQVKSSVRIEDVVGEVVRLRKSGSYRFMGLCPFHSEKSPSFTVHATLQIYKCFSCGEGGDVFSFLMKTQGIGFFEALKLLADRYGIPMPKRSQYADDDSRKRGALFQLHELAQENFRANLRGPAGETARNYLAHRGLSAETIERFGLGYSDRSGRALLRTFEQREFSASQMQEAGLVGQRQDGSLYDRFRNRLMFPIHNESGKIIGFGGRALADDDQPKYLNSPETPIYKKSHVLYNLHRAKDAIRKEDRVILVEGYMDAIGVSAAGFAAVVASCGTALTPQHVQALKRHTQRIFVNFDPDAAGASAAERSIHTLLQEGMHARMVELDGGLDPDEYCRDRGSAAYQARLEGAKGYFYWLADRARNKYDVHTPEGVVGVLQTLLPAVQQIADPLERSAIAGDVAAYIGVERGLVLDTFRKSAAAREDKPLERPKVVLRPDERMVLRTLFLDRENSSEVLAELKSIESLNRLPTRRIFQAVFAQEAASPDSAPNSGGVSFDLVNARLEDADRQLLAEAVLREDTAASREEAMAAVASLRRAETEDRRKQIKLRIKELERGGKWDEALRLTAELQDLERKGRGAQ